MTAPSKVHLHSPGDAGIAPGASAIETPGHTWGTMSLRVTADAAVISGHDPGPAAELPFAPDGYLG